MPTPIRAAQAMIEQMVRARLPPQLLDWLDVEVDSSPGGGHTLRITWPVPSGTQYNIVEHLDDLASPHSEPTSVLLDRCLYLFEQANRRDLDLLANQYGIARPRGIEAWLPDSTPHDTARRLFRRDPKPKAAPKPSKPSPKPKRAIDRLLEADDFLESARIL